MSWDIRDRFPNWGESGESPPDGFFYDGGDQVNEKHLDYLWDSVKGLEDDVQASLNDIDSNSDGRVDAADTATLVKGNDIDSDGDGKVDSANTADTATSISDVNYSDLSNVTKIESGQATISSGNFLTIKSSYNPKSSSSTITGITSAAPSNSTGGTSTYGLTDQGQSGFPKGEIGYIIQNALAFDSMQIVIYNYTDGSSLINYAFYEVEQ
jgi:hypothetical protein